jgi:hypothetical protein
MIAAKAGLISATFHRSFDGTRMFTALPDVMRYSSNN